MLKISQILFHLILTTTFFFKREWKREKERETETSTGCLPYAPKLGMEPAAQAYALTGNQTQDLLICRMTPNQLSHTGQGLTTAFEADIMMFVLQMGKLRLIECFKAYLVGKRWIWIGI